MPFMVYNFLISGLCEKCGVKITNPLDGTQALGHLYHAHCFTCCYCGEWFQFLLWEINFVIFILERPLKGKKFYEARGKIYCEEDYLVRAFFGIMESNVDDHFYFSTRDSNIRRSVVQCVVI